MNAVSHLGSLLTQRPIVLVVEDRITKEYLLAVWGAEQQYFNVIVAGGHRVVDGVVNDFRRHNVTHVFGLLDRDFGETNKLKWLNSIDPPCVFRLPRHELENYLLDWNALSGCDLNRKRRNRSAVEIEQHGKKEAARQAWWLACRRQLHAIQKDIGQGFPPHPSIGAVTTDQEAVDFITKSTWFTELGKRLATACDTVSLREKVHADGEDYVAQLNGKTWVQNFSGKEVFSALQSYVYDAPSDTNPEADLDLAKSIAAWQVSNGAVPLDIMELKKAIKRRVNLP